MDQHNKNALKSLLRRIVGVILITFGIIGLVLPFLQGVIMILAGTYLLGNKYLIKKIKQLRAYWKRKKHQ